MTIYIIRLYCIVLYCIVLYCIVLYCIVHETHPYFYVLYLIFIVSYLLFLLDIFIATLYNNHYHNLNIITKYRESKTDFRYFYFLNLLCIFLPFQTI
ncbi:hypothetical protein FYL24_05105 [Lactobacillus salivarius]|nr:hypothetical protein [Ligilactobacillus salivarius]